MSPSSTVPSFRVTVSAWAANPPSTNAISRRHRSVRMDCLPGAAYLDSHILASRNAEFFHFNRDGERHVVKKDRFGDPMSHRFHQLVGALRDHFANHGGDHVVGH